MQGSLRRRPARTAKSRADESQARSLRLWRLLFAAAVILLVGSGRASLEVERLAAQEPPPNNPATGTPVMTGTPRVGEVVWLDVSAIADPDGIDSADFSFAWIADDDLDLINGHEPLAWGGLTRWIIGPDDAGKLLGAYFSFNDDAGHLEEIDIVYTSRVAATVPAPPEDLDASVGQTGTLTLTWAAPTWNRSDFLSGDSGVGDGGSDITGYIVQWRLASGSWGTAGDVTEATVTGTTHTISGLNASSTYRVRVLAQNAIGRGAPSTEVTVSGTDLNVGPVVSGERFVGWFEHHSTSVYGTASTYTASDPENDSVSWSLAGPDSSAFDIHGGTLRFTLHPDFENPQDEDRNNAYEVVVVASDGSNVGSQAVTVVVEGIEEPPVIDGPSSVQHQEDSAADVAVYRAEDPEGYPVRWSHSGTDATAFEFTDGTLRFLQPPDLDDPGDADENNVYHVTVSAFAANPTAAFGPETGSLDVIITVTDVNEAPEAEDDQADVNEDDSVTIDVLANDSDQEDDRSDLTVSAGNARNGQVVVNAPQNPGDLYTVTYTPRANYNGEDSFAYTVQDSGSPTFSDTANVSINVHSVNDTPAFASATVERSVSESANPGVEVGVPVTAMDVDEDDTLTYSLSGTDAGSFDIGRDSGQIAVGTGVTFDTATKDTYTVTVTATDSGTPPRSARVDVTITVTAGPVGPAVTIGGGGGGGGGDGPSPSAVDFEWAAKHDIDALDSGHDMPTGMWSDGVTLWILDNPDGAGDAVYAYDAETGERLEDREFALDERNRAPRGIWSDGTGVAWVSDSGRDRLFAYDLGTGERLEDRDIVLAEGNRDPHGIWSDGRTMWVLNRNPSLFAYDLASGDLLGEFALDARNGDPYGIWSDGVTIWVSDHDEKDLLAYRLPTHPEAEATGEDASLGRVHDEDFTNLSSASNNSPRGIWADGDVMYVADESDDRVYTYNMPDAIDARLASLTLSGVDIGDFTPGQREYPGSVAEGVTETTVEAVAVQSGAGIAIDPPDADADAEGHQVAIEGAAAITVAVTSEDGSRERVYRVRLGEPEQAAASEPTFDCFRGEVAVGFSHLVYGGGSIEDLEACAESRHITALYALDGGAFVSYVLGAPEFVNASFRELFADGLPVLTPLTAKSEGPPTADPFADGAAADDVLASSWPQCLRGEIVEGFSLVLYGGGSIDDLESCAQSRGVTALYALSEGEFVSYILGAPDFVNQRFHELYSGGLSPISPLVARSAGPSVASAGSDADVEN